MFSAAKSILITCALTVTTLGVAVAADLDKIKADQKIRIGFASDKPWTFREADGSLVGIEPDIMREILEPLGVKDIDPVTTEFNALIPGLQSDRFDVTNGGLYITPPRCKLVAFSNPYLKVADALVVLKGNPKQIKSYKDFAENTSLHLGTQRGSITAQNAESAGVPMGSQLLLPDTPSLVSALLSGRIDAFSGSLGYVVALMQDQSVTGLERATPFTGYVDASGKEKLGFAAFAFQPEAAALKAGFDDGLKRMIDDGSLEKILMKYGFSKDDVPAGNTSEELCKE